MKIIKMLPIELYRYISYFLKPGWLSICKELHLLYDDNWYKTKLYMKSQVNLSTASTYKKLYRLYSQSGTICKLSLKHDDIEITNLPIEGIKCATANIFTDMILTFDGKLYLNEYGKIPYIIDTEVIDICNHAYIKKYELYTADSNNNFKTFSISLISEDPLLSIAFIRSNGYIIAITTYNIYYAYSLYKDEFSKCSLDKYGNCTKNGQHIGGFFKRSYCNFFNMFSTNFTGMKKIVSICDSTIILDNKNNVCLFHPRKLLLPIINEVQNIKYGLIIRKNDNMVIEGYVYDSILNNIFHYICNIKYNCKEKYFINDDEINILPLHPKLNDNVLEKINNLFNLDNIKSVTLCRNLYIIYKHE